MFYFLLQTAELRTVHVLNVYSTNIYLEGIIKFHPHLNLLSPRHFSKTERLSHKIPLSHHHHYYYYYLYRHSVSSIEFK